MPRDKILCSTDHVHQANSENSVTWATCRLDPTCS